MSGPLKVLLLLACLLTLAFGTSPAQADPSTNPSDQDCLGVERGERNRSSGDRAYGEFGQEQSAFVQTFAHGPGNYGQYLQTWKAANCP